MVTTAVTRLSDRLDERFDDAVRSVGYYDSDQSEFIFVRDDVEAEYQKGDLDRVFRDSRLEAIDHPHQESLYSHGKLQCTVRCFEKATELHFVLGETEGIMAAVDAGVVDDLRGTIDECRDAIIT